jgi:hypothetical protein
MLRTTLSLIGCLWLHTVVVAFRSPAAQETHPADKPAEQVHQAAPKRYLIREGTVVHLRLAQPVRGVYHHMFKAKEYSRKGDVVRLVVTDDVLVKGAVVIAKGARGQATVVDVAYPSSGANNIAGLWATEAMIYEAIPQTGAVFLKLDWVEDVTGEQVTISQSETQVSKPFRVTVSFEHNGTVVRPSQLRRDASPTSIKKSRPWAPTGTRLEAYVDGPVLLDAGEVMDAQDSLPIRNADAIVTIYRVKDGKPPALEVSCDGKPLTKLDAEQFFTTELTPGLHTITLGADRDADFTATAGNQSYLMLRNQSAKVGWQLTPVTLDEGVDDVADLDEAKTSLAAATTP